MAQARCFWGGDRGGALILPIGCAETTDKHKLMAGRGSFLRSSACSSPPGSGSPASTVQRVRAREHIFRRVAALVPSGLAGTFEDLLVVKPDENSFGLQAIKANPSKPSVDAMLTYSTN